jgi:LuxR family maltose regulon positive regulatory protein
MLHREYVPQVTLIKALIVDDTEASRQQAIDQLAQLQGFVERVDNIRYQIEVFALQSLIDDAQGNEQAAMNKVEQAIRLSEPGGWIRLFVDLGPGMASLLHKLQNKDVALDYIGQILDAFEPGEHQPITTNHGLAEPLTDRELEVLALLKERLSNKEIASHLIVSANTVRQHNSNIYRKLQVNTRREAVNKAIVLEIFLPD